MESETGAIVTGASALWGTAIAILALLGCSAFFSGSETALTAASRGKLHAMADKGNGGATSALRLTDDSERLIGAILLGNNLVNILAASLATSLFTTLFGDSGVALATLIMTLLVLIFAEVMPKTYAISNPETAASRVAPFVAILVRIFAPVVNVVRAVVRVVLSIFGVKTDPDAMILAHEEIAGAIALHHSEGAVEKDDRDRLLGALDLRHREVEEIMLHRSHIEMVDADDDPQDIISQCLNSRHTRLPVYKDNSENIVGVIHAKDVLREVDRLIRSSENGLANLERFDVLDVAMEPYFIPDTTSLDDQMRQFLRRKSHFALVVDEYGSLMGLITLEDILEEIVGEIADEHDSPEIEFRRLKDGSLMVDGAMTIRDFNRAFDSNLPDEEANTIAGLIIHEAQIIPVVGQVFSFHGFRFEIVEKDRNRLVQVKLRRL
ncbi:HlyC/CorC family transporter [Oceanomicrobium pacificus]|uniref:DUF21 domain-containing protein n=1 Tax=Oceanomicrobium pacificus TaxID=2692916 RepID=A0A6B0U5S1_9RHOB|nr:HlyC/CorC family transporter [Oceanomicrobium pacificus]MXU66251.1 DUF21 domain-containing protein [Oceanomicrobium pacificus]